MASGTASRARSSPRSTHSRPCGGPRARAGRDRLPCGRMFWGPARRSPRRSRRSRAGLAESPRTRHGCGVARRGVHRRFLRAVKEDSTRRAQLMAEARASLGNLGQTPRREHDGVFLDRTARAAGRGGGGRRARAYAGRATRSTPPGERGWLSTMSGLPPRRSTRSTGSTRPRPPPDAAARRRGRRPNNAQAFWRRDPGESPREAGRPHGGRGARA